jgi:hypothetical protein
MSTSTMTDGSGNYTFMDLRAGGDYTIIPARARMKFTPASRSFNNLRQNGSADFVGFGEREPKSISEHDPKSPAECTEADEARERQVVIAVLRRTLQGERDAIIAENVRERKFARAILGPVEPQISFSNKCKVASGLVRYMWQIQTTEQQPQQPGQPQPRVLTVKKRLMFFCGKVPGGWLCKL